MVMPTQHIPNGETWRAALVWGARAIIGMILVLGGLGKLFYLGDFKKLLDAYRLLPSPLVSPISTLLPAAEVLFGITIFIVQVNIYAAIGAVGLFAVFIVAISVNLVRGRHELPCGCFGKRTEALSWLTVLRDFALIGLAVLATGRMFAVPLIVIAAYAVAFLAKLMRRYSAQVARPVS